MILVSELMQFKFTLESTVQAKEHEKSMIEQELQNIASVKEVRSIIHSLISSTSTTGTGQVTRNRNQTLKNRATSYC